MTPDTFSMYGDSNHLDEIYHFNKTRKCLKCFMIFCELVFMEILKKGFAITEREAEEDVRFVRYFVALRARLAAWAGK
jgi:hypothetical protein